MSEESKQGEKPAANRIPALAAVLVLAVAAVFLFPWIRDLGIETTRFLLDRDGAREWIDSRQPYSSLYFVGLQTLQVIISPVPGELSCFLGGLVFGPWWGFFLSTVGLTLGSLVNVSLGRAFERAFLEKVLPRTLLDSFEARSKKWGLLTVFILFLIPGGPKDTFCYLFGLTRIPIAPFLLASSLARIPGTLVLALQGAKVFEGDWSFFLIMTGGSLAVLIPALLYKDRILKKLGVKES
ncbi:MAG: VTT domain-containing protein [Pseudomonadota bacterium]